ncbi:hypothetical protein GCM10010519_18990 [Streptomyces lactacystinicus]
MPPWKEFVERVHQLVRTRAVEQSSETTYYFSFRLGREMAQGTGIYRDPEEVKEAALGLLAAHKQTQDALDNLLHIYTASAVASGATYSELAKVWGTTRQGARHRWLTLNKQTDGAPLPVPQNQPSPTLLWPVRPPKKNPRRPN